VSSEETPRKGRSNAILTYETVDEIRLGVQQAILEVRQLRHEFEEAASTQRATYSDHEVRIRALELTIAGAAASRGTATWLWHAVWPAAAVIIAVLSYLQLKP
jgi:hypothetical protein